MVDGAVAEGAVGEGFGFGEGPVWVGRWGGESVRGGRPCSWLSVFLEKLFFGGGGGGGFGFGFLFLVAVVDEIQQNGGEEEGDEEEVLLRGWTVGV